MHIACVDLSGTVQLGYADDGKSCEALDIHDIEPGQHFCGDGIEYFVYFASGDHDVVAAWIQGVKAFQAVMRPSFTQGK